MTENFINILSAFGNAIFNSFWQMGILWLITISYSKLYKKTSAQTLSRISFFGLLIGFTGFLATFLIFLFSPKTDIGIVRFLNNMQLSYTVLIFTGLAYILFLIVPVIKFARGIRSAYRLKNKGVAKVPGHIKIYLLNAVQYLNIKRRVKIFTSTIITSPLTLGFIKPIILLPVAIVNMLSPQQVESIILHELAHIKRNDYLQNIITHIVLTILYFNPFAKLLADIQNLEREKVADKLVMQFEYNALQYADTLLQFAKLNATIQPLAIHASGRPKILLERVEWIFGSSQRNFPSPKKVFSLCVVILVAVAISLFQNAGNSINVPDRNLSALKPPALFQFASSIDSTPSIVSIPNQENEMQSNTTVKKAICSTKTCSNQKAKVNKIENEPPASEPQPTARYITNVAEVGPVLTDNEEQRVQEAIAATKKIIIEMNWKEIEKAFAETITSNEKEVLKEVYDQKMEAVDFKKQTDLLRRQYKSINWDKTDKKLYGILAGIKLDSAYNKVNAQVKDLSDQVKELSISKNNRLNLSIDSLNKKATHYNLILKRLDSLRSKKIISL